MGTEIKLGGTPSKGLQQLGSPIKVKGHDKFYYVKEPAIVGMMYALHCPDCGFELAKKIQNTGIHKHICPQCKTVVGFGAIAQSTTVGGEKEQQEQQEKKPTVHFNMGGGMGEIVWSHLLCTKRYKLGTETVTIGRKDKNEPSTISLSDDYVSRRSVTIEPLKTDKGFLFKFTVQRTSNPIFVNDREIMVGNSIYLNYGDNIKMGKTTLTFRQLKKK